MCEHQIIIVLHTGLLKARLLCQDRSDISNKLYKRGSRFFMCTSYKFNAKFSICINMYGIIHHNENISIKVLSMNTLQTVNVSDIANQTE